MTAVLLVGFIVLMLTGVPVALAMVVASLAYVMLSGTVPDFVVIWNTPPPVRPSSAA